MAKRGWPWLVTCLIAAGAAGGFAGMARTSPHPVPFGLSRPEALAAFVLLALISAFLWWRFSRLQDEMFHRIQNYSYGWGASITVAVLIIWGIANGATLAPPIDPFAPLIIFAVIKGFFWTVATRKWL